MTKALLCTQIKLENSYLREWIEYHKNIGFSHIIISDNNDITGEDPICVIDDYVQSGYVDIDYTYRNCGQGWQAPEFTKIVNQYKDEYDWIAFFDLDEFLYLSPKYNNSVINFLESNPCFNNFNGIAINWITYGDNGYIESSSFNILNRFDSPLNLTSNITKNLFFKSIINAKKWEDNYQFSDAHGINWNNKSIYCDCCGNIIQHSNQVSIPNTNEVYLKHFITKSLHEYLNQKGVRGLQWEMYKNVMDLYKDINGWSQEYENYYQYKINNCTYNEKKILICIFYEHDEMLDILQNVSYINHINQYENIDYMFCHNNNDLTCIYFSTYFNVFKNIYENNNNYDVIVCVNEKIYLNIHLLNRFINIIYDDKKIYTEMIQSRSLNNNQLSERMFILSKKHLEDIVNSEYIKEHNECLPWFPSYTLGIIFENTEISSLGYIYFYETQHTLNNLTESIFTYVLTSNYSNDIHTNIYNSFNEMTNFINLNDKLFILRLHKMNYKHFGDYIDMYKEYKIEDTIHSIPV